jgi:hypothetical protein
MVDSDEYTIMKLSESEQLKNLLGLRGKLVDTNKSSNKDQLGLLNKVRTGSLRLSDSPDSVSLTGSILLEVYLGSVGQLSSFLGLVLKQVGWELMKTRHTASRIVTAASEAVAFLTAAAVFKYFSAI